MQKYLKIIIWIIIFFLALLYIYCYRPLVDDELYGFGFGINILNGLVPYRDFNMIVTPMFSYIVAFFLLLFGKYLIVYHVIISLIITFITYISYKKQGFLAIILYLLLLIYPFTGYNMFSLLLLFILLNLKNNKKYLLLEVMIISMMILTKQVLVFLVIPSLLYSKNKKKSFLIYLGVGLLFLLYLIFNNSLYEFFDYCFFGMFDFTSKNNEGINFLLIIEIFIIIYLLYRLIKTRKKDVFYILMFQIMAFPIVNYQHFIISFIPFVYYIFKFENRYLNLMIGTFFITYFIFFSIGIMNRDNTYLYVSNSKINNFYKGRMVQNYLNSTVLDIEKVIEQYVDYEYFLFGNFSYLVKLTNNDTINKYDLINNGNMGYKGSSKYIDEIDDYCSNNKCLFILEHKDINVNQTNEDILNYVKQNYYYVKSGNVCEVYINKR